MADLHLEADERNVDFSKLPVDRSGWDRFLDKDMLDDECVDWMAKMLCQAVGSTMPGAETETVSPMLEISTNHSGKYVVLGVLHAESLRRVVSGRSPDLIPVLRTLVGKRNVEEVLARRLDPLSSKDLLVLQTQGKHTSLVELTRSRSSVDSDGGWSLCIYDTSNANPQLDPALNRGINALLNATGPERAGAKTGTRLRVPRKYPVYIQQKDSKVCGLTTFINLVQKLTGEVLDPHYWPLFVDLVRLFFDIWIQTWIAIHPGKSDTSNFLTHRIFMTTIFAGDETSTGGEGGEGGASSAEGERTSTAGEGEPPIHPRAPSVASKKRRRGGGGGAKKRKRIPHSRQRASAPAWPVPDWSSRAILFRISKIIQKVTNGIGGNVEGFDGSVNATSAACILRSLRVKGRFFVDLGCGYGWMIAAAFGMGAVAGVGIELPANIGQMSIYERVIKKMQEEKVGFTDSFQQKHKFIHLDINEVFAVSIVS
jgi:hypothetical protein